MMMRYIFFIATVFFFSTPALAEDTVVSEFTGEQLAFFETKARPVLAESCYLRHQLMFSDAQALGNSMWAKPRFWSVN